jgi:hypothetical protein
MLLNPMPKTRSAAWTARLVVASLVVVPAALASTNNFVVPTFRGQPNSEIGFWERFTVAYGAPGNTADQPGSTSGAIVTQVLSPSAFATGSGNIYDPSAPMAFTLTDTTPFTLGTVVLQIRTLGSELAYDEVRLSYNDGATTRSLAPISRQELDRGTVLGASVSALWQWDLQGLGITEYSIAFGTPDSSLSMDAITVDTWSGFTSVPEPSPVGLLLGGALAIALPRLRRR